MNDEEAAIKAGLDLAHKLAQYTGSDVAYYGFHRTVHYTEGFKAFQDNAGRGASWLFDILATQPQILNNVRGDGFAVVRLRVRKDKSAELVVDDGGRGDVAMVYYRRLLTYTDCPPAPQAYWEGEWKFYMEVSEVGGKPTIMLMLPAER